VQCNTYARRVQFELDYSRCRCKGIVRYCNGTGYPGKNISFLRKDELPSIEIEVVMILLAATTDKLQLVTSAAGSIDVHASWLDMTAADPPVIKGSTSGRKNTAIVTATTADIVPSPGSGVLRNVKTMTIRNKHATIPCDVTVFYEGSTTDADVEHHKCTLVPGAVLEYTEDFGFQLVEPPFSTISRRFALASDFTNSTITPTECTGLSVVTGLGTFKFQYLIRYQTAATTTGIRFSVNHAGTVGWIVYNGLYVDNLATASSGAADQDALAATAQVYGAYAARAKSTAGTMVTASVDTINADMLLIIDGLINVTVDGELELWWGSEVAASAAVVKQGSSVVVEKIA
jgi:hypothetical protein